MPTLTRKIFSTITVKKHPQLWDLFSMTDHLSKSHVPNIFVLDSHMIAAISGGSGPLLKDLPAEWQLFKSKVRGSISVARASKFMTNFLSSWGKKGLPVGMLIGGLEEGGTALYHVAGEGTMEDCREQLYATKDPPEFVGFANGCGATGALAVVHSKLHKELSAAEAADMATTAICYGVCRTLEPGSFVSVYQVDSNGWMKCVSDCYVREWKDTYSYYNIKKTLENQRCKVTRILRTDSHFRRPSSKIGEKRRSVSSALRGSGQAALKTQGAEINENKDCSFLYRHKGKGPTTVGFIFKGEVFLATDHLSKSHVPNIVVLNSHMLAAISGGSEIFLEDMRNKWQLYERKARGCLSVESASKWISHFLSCWREEGLPVGMLIGGLDEGGPALYHVDGKGKIEACIEKLYATGEQPLFIRFATGCGAAGALAIVHFRLRNELSAAAAADVPKAATCYGVRRTVEAGSFVTIYQIVPDGGWTKCISGDDVKEWKDKYEGIKT